MRFVQIAFGISKGSNMEINSEEQESPKDADLTTPYVHISVDQDQSIEKDQSVEMVEPLDRLKDVTDLRSEHQANTLSLDWSH